MRKIWIDIQRNFRKEFFCNFSMTSATKVLRVVALLTVMTQSLAYYTGGKLQVRYTYKRSFVANMLHVTLFQERRSGAWRTEILTSEPSTGEPSTSRDSAPICWRASVAMMVGRCISVRASVCRGARLRVSTKSS